MEKEEMGKSRNTHEGEFWKGNLNERCHMEGLVVSRTVLKLILNK
jgi:hypothetical protein